MHYMVCDHNELFKKVGNNSPITFDDTKTEKQRRYDQQGRAQFKIRTPQHLQTGTNKGMGQEIHTQTNRAGRHRQEGNLTQ